MSTSSDEAREQAERILEALDEDGFDYPDSLTVRSVADVVDTTVPFPVNYKRIVEQLTEN